MKDITEKINEDVYGSGDILEDIRNTVNNVLRSKEITDENNILLEWAYDFLRSHGRKVKRTKYKEDRHYHDHTFDTTRRRVNRDDWHSKYSYYQLTK